MSYTTEYIYLLYGPLYNKIFHSFRFLMLCCIVGWFLMLCCRFVGWIEPCCINI